jgi:hypothetical protein
MSRKRFLAGAGAGAIAAVFLLSAGGAGVAQASSIEYFNGGFSRTISTYSTSLHRLSVYDSRSDGWGSLSQWNTVGPASGGSLVNTTGFGTTKSQTFANLGGQIYYNACAKNGSTIIGCSGVRSDSR